MGHPVIVMRIAILFVACWLAAGVAAASGPGLRLEFYRVSVLDGSADISIDNGSVSETASVDSGANNDFGLRAVGWSGSSPLAGGIDIGALSTREHGGPMVDARINWFAFFGGLRAREPRFARNGHGLRPYALFGLSMVNADGSLRTQTQATSFESGTGFGLSPGKPGDISPYLAAGVEWDPLDSLVITLDYRVQRYDIDTDVLLSPEHVQVDLDASGIGLGIAWRLPSRQPAAP